MWNESVDNGVKRAREEREHVVMDESNVEVNVDESVKVEREKRERA